MPLKNPPMPAQSDVRLAGLGIIAETFPQVVIAGSTIMIDGTVYWMAIPLQAGQVVTGAVIAISTGGAGVSLSKLGLYDSAINRLALTADQGAAWNSSGLKQAAFTAPYTVPVTGIYYFAMVAKTATTMPTPWRGVASGTGAAGLTGKPAPYGTQQTQTDLPNPGTLGATSAIGYWGALY